MKVLKIKYISEFEQTNVIIPSTCLEALKLRTKARTALLTFVTERCPSFFKTMFPLSHFLALISRSFVKKSGCCIDVPYRSIIFSQKFGGFVDA